MYMKGGEEDDATTRAQRTDPLIVELQSVIFPTKEVSDYIKFFDNGEALFHQNVFKFIQLFLIFLQF